MVWGAQNTAPRPSPGDVGAQAVALRIAGDQAAFYGCGIYGAQDTLLDDRGRHFFRDCFIEGSIDFIFGNARSLYQVYMYMILNFYIYYTYTSVANKSLSTYCTKRSTRTASTEDYQQTFSDCGSKFDKKTETWMWM